MTNRTLTTLLKGMVSKSLSDWDAKLSYAKFAYNRTPSYVIFYSPFEVYYDLNPLTSHDHILIPQECKVSFEAKKRAKEIKKLHQQVRTQIKKVNERYRSEAYKNCTYLKFKSIDLL